MIANHDSAAAGIGCSNPYAVRALVLGSGLAAEVAAQTLKLLGSEVTLVRISGTRSHACFSADGQGSVESVNGPAPGLEGVEIVDVDKAPAIRREGDAFEVMFENGIKKSYDCVILSPSVSLRPRQRNLPDATELFEPLTQIGPSRRVAFLMDYEHPSDPGLGMAAIKAACDHAKNGGRSAVFFRNVPVHHLFGETLYDEARASGVQFVRFVREPVVEEHPGDADADAVFRVKATDPIDGKNEFVFDCDGIFTVTGPDPSTVPEWAAQIMDRGDLDDRGFALSESAHCISGSALGSGIFVVGEGTGNLDGADVVTQARATAARAYAWMRSRHPKGRATSIGFGCVGCLTCYRVCPHNAVSMKPGTSRPTIEIRQSWCRECGICASLCPAGAIISGPCPDDDVQAAVGGVSQEDIRRTTFVFGCERSAGAAAQSIRIPNNMVFVPVPCAGRVSEHIIWFTLAAGAAGVLVLGCHGGNCASRNGTDRASARIRRGLAAGVIGETGPKLGYATIAANEPARLQRLLREFS